MFGNSQVRSQRAKWQIDLAVHNAFEIAAPAGSVFQRVFRHVHQNSAMLRTLPIGGAPGWLQARKLVGGLAALASDHANWLQDVATWTPRQESAWSQFACLVRHLFSKAPVPGFMTGVWLEGRSADARRRQGWYRHLGLGYGIRGLETPTKLTKIMARHFTQAPDHFTVDQAVRWGQVRGLGAEESLANAIATSRLGSNFEHEAYWTQAILFLIDSPGFAMSDVGSILEYLEVNRRLLPRPPRGATMRKKGDEFMRAVRLWRTEAPTAKGLPSFKWKSSGISGLLHDESLGIWKPSQWRIRELLDSNELWQEGRSMRHCVGIYDRRCVKGNASIWSMTCSDSAEQCRHELTIEVDLQKRRIVQARGLRNAAPTPDARRIMTLWAERERLKVENWV